MITTTKLGACFAYMYLYTLWCVSFHENDHGKQWVFTLRVIGQSVLEIGRLYGEPFLFELLTRASRIMKRS